MNELGNASLIFALLVSVFTLAANAAGIWKKDWRFVEVGFRGVYVNLLFMSIAVVLLLNAFLSNDFSLQYVVGYSEKSLPVFYKITGLWAGQEGSLLFWGWLVALYTAIIVARDGKRPGATYMPYVLLFLNGTIVFFLILLNFVTMPFELIARVPVDGNGLNPLLQNPGMVFHPPTLYLGYVGFTIPFSFAMAALMMGDEGDWWIKKTRAWTLFSWMFLTLGIVFGGWWAYRELGWGGVWGWDPVENSSIMPWFTATAFLHSVMIQERRGMLKIWNLTLIILTFSLSIFGTFITRSGIIASVHSFGQSSVGFVFLGFLAVILAVSFYLVATRYNMLREHNPRVDSLISKESSFLYNNIILMGLCFATFWGTVFPLVSEAVKGVKISVGPPFFNTVNPPLFLLLIALMALCPLLGWRSTSIRSVMRNLVLPLSAMALSVPVLLFLGVTRFMPMFFYAFSLFVVISVGRELYQGARVSVKNAESGLLRALARHAVKNGRRYGGFLVHVGMIMIVVGLAGYGYHQFKEDFNMRPGETVKVGKYSLVYKGLHGDKEKTYDSVEAVVEVYDASGFVGVLKPSKRFYTKKATKAEPSTEVAILQRLKEDVYLILAGWEQDESASITVIINPLLMWVWIGTGVIVLGIIWCVLPRRRRDTELDTLTLDLLNLAREKQ